MTTSIVVKGLNRVERPFARLKPFRRVATRYEKLKVAFLGMVYLALGPSGSGS